MQLGSDEVELMKYRLRELMNHRKPFLQKGYHIKDMAEDLRIPVHQLSAFINKILGVSFSEFMNKYRIDHCVSLINTDPRNHSDLSQLSEKCGFNNRNSFTAAFKKFTGLKPFEYIREKSMETKV